MNIVLIGPFLISVHVLKVERAPILLLSPGVVGLWDLTTNSALLRVRESDRSQSLLPYRCILAHNSGVRALAFCPASR